MTRAELMQATLLALTRQNVIRGADAGGIVRDGLIIWYDGINNTGDGHSGDTAQWWDLSGCGNHGRIANGTWNDDELVFNGANTWVNCGPQNYAALTIECLVTFASSPTIVNIVDNYQNGGYGWMRQGGGQLQFQVYRNNAYQILLAGATEVGQPILVTGVANSAFQAVYRDGGFLDSAEYAVPISQTTEFTVFALGVNPRGSTYDSPAYWFAGAIKSFRMYDRVLTAEEIAQNYRYDKRRFRL